VPSREADFEGRGWNPSPTKCDKRNVYNMKATGIVRRIEEYGIIGQTSKKPHKH